MQKEAINGEFARIHYVVGEIIRQFPRRQACSEEERLASEWVAQQFTDMRIPVEWHSFFFNDNLYQNGLLHTAPAVLGTMISGIAPALALPLHLLPAISYTLDSTRKAYLGRRLLPWKPSQNLLATLSAKNPRLRIVLCAHIDAAFTGAIFWPAVIRNVGQRPLLGIKAMHRSIQATIFGQFALAGLDLLRMAAYPVSCALRPIEWLLTIPSLLSSMAFLDVVLRNNMVPGANDNLSGVAALLVLAERLAKNKRDDVEFVFALTGAEEASLGGADAIAREFSSRWDKENTVIIGLDSISNGELCYLVQEGEVWAKRIPAWLEKLCKDTATEPRFSMVGPFSPPVGGTDIGAFLAHGWQGVCLTCIDKTLGAPGEYHMPTDNLENLDIQQVIHSIDFTQALIENIINTRLQPHGGDE